MGSAAYWVDQTRQRPSFGGHRIGATLAEETAACLLGGYGMPASVGLAAFAAVRDAGLLRTASPPDWVELEAALREPIHVPGRARPVRYRFPRQRAHRLAAALAHLSNIGDHDSGPELRDALLRCPGIGPKTASWVARNWLGSDEVAVIDVHLRRAGLAAGFFCPLWRLPAEYRLFERAFCAVARLGGVSAAAMDACIWDQLQYLGPAGRLVTGDAAWA